MPAAKAAKAYSGRLAFDSDTGFHLAEDGKPVVTEDEGKTWRYATADDPSHIERYQQRVLEIDSTANKFAELAFEHGPEQAKAMVDEHHWYEPDPTDPAPADPDHVAKTITSHTVAYAEGASDE
jgi:hypothetical protein